MRTCVQTPTGKSDPAALPSVAYLLDMLSEESHGATVFALPAAVLQALLDAGIKTADAVVLGSGSTTSNDLEADARVLAAVLQVRRVETWPNRTLPDAENASTM